MTRKKFLDYRKNEYNTSGNNSLLGCISIIAIIIYLLFNVFYFSIFRFRSAVDQFNPRIVFIIKEIISGISFSTGFTAIILRISFMMKKKSMGTIFESVILFKIEPLGTAGCLVGGLTLVTQLWISSIFGALGKY